MFCDYVFRIDHSYTYSYLDRFKYYDLIRHKVYATTTKQRGGKMKEKIRKLINDVYKMGVYAMENGYHPSTINTLTTIELQLKILLKTNKEGKDDK